MSRTTGKPLSGDAHLAQSLGDLFSTPIGSRVGRRDYGSLLAELVDQPANALGRMRLIAATALAVLRWEPRIRLTSVALAQNGPAAFAVTLTGKRTDTAQPNSLTRLTIPLPTGPSAAKSA